MQNIHSQYSHCARMSVVSSDQINKRSSFIKCWCSCMTQTEAYNWKHLLLLSSLSSKRPPPSLLPVLSVPAVCCCRRATSSPRHSTTISWPLGAGQPWLVSTAPLFPFFFLLTISSSCGCGCAVSRQQWAQAAVNARERNRWQRAAGVRLN